MASGSIDAGRERRHGRLAPLAGLLVTFTVLAAPAAAGSRTAAEGVYTAEQARQGLEVHEEYCAKCHHHSYFQGSFLLSWQNQPVSALYDLIELKMPEDRPGSLKPREYAALLAYVFELNGLPAGGEKLSHEPEAMADILITSDP
jgi:mono/diheme cytochrome c family protein